MARMTKSTEYIRHTYTSDERLKMGEELAGAHNRLADIESEESVIKAQVKEKKSQVEQTVAKLSRELSTGFTMENIRCKLVYDKPNHNEVSYHRIDTGEVVKTRAMTPDEMQEELPLTNRDGEVEVIPPAVAEAVAEQSAENIAEFFDKPEGPSTADLDVVAAEQETAQETAKPDIYAQAVAVVRAEGEVSTSILQRKLDVSYTDAVALLDRLRADGEPKLEEVEPAPETPRRSRKKPPAETTPEPEPQSATPEDVQEGW